jgi:hypothetical protein
VIGRSFDLFSVVRFGMSPRLCSVEVNGIREID